MRALTPQTLTPGAELDITLLDHEAQAVLYNESPYTLTVTTVLGGRTLPAWTGDLFELQRGGSGGRLSIMPAVVLSQSNAPAFSIAGDVYYDTEKPLGVYPIALARQVSVGNQVNTKVGGVDDATMTQGHPITRGDQALAQLGFGLNSAAAGGINTFDKNAVIEGQNNTQSMNSYFNGTNDIYINSAQSIQWQLFAGGMRLRWSTDVTPTAGNTVTWSAWVVICDNNANLKLTEPASQIGAGALPAGVTLPGAQVTGAVASATAATTAQQVDSTNSGNVNVPQVSTATAGAGLGVKDNKASGYVEFYPTENDATARGVQLDYIDAAGALHAVLKVSAAGITYQGPGPTGAVVRSASYFSGGGGGGTFSHGYPASPAFVGVTCNVVNSTETVGADSYGSSTVHINLGAALAWNGVAMG